MKFIQSILASTRSIERIGMLALFASLCLGVASAEESGKEETTFETADAIDGLVPEDKVISDKLERIIIPRIRFEDAAVAEAIDFLRLRAAELDHGESDPTMRGFNINIIVPSDEFAKVQDTVIPSLTMDEVSLKDAIRHVAEAAGLQVRIGHSGVELVKNIDEKPARRGVGEDDPINVKLREIIVPSVNLDSASLAEALDFLRFRAKELDKEADFGGRKGVNIVIRSDDRRQEDKSITLRMRNASLGAILDLIAEQAGMKISIRNSAVVMEPKDARAEGE